MLTDTADLEDFAPRPPSPAARAQAHAEIFRFLRWATRQHHPGPNRDTIGTRLLAIARGRGSFTAADALTWLPAVSPRSMHRALADLAGAGKLTVYIGKSKGAGHGRGKYPNLYEIAP